MLSKDEWDFIEKKLKGVSSCFRRVEFEYKGHKVSVRGYLNKERLNYVVYIDGWIKGEWDENNKPIIKELWAKKEKFLYSPSIRKKMAKMNMDEANRKFVMYSPSFSSFSAFKRAYSKLEGLKMVEEVCCEE